MYGVCVRFHVWGCVCVWVYGDCVCVCKGVYGLCVYGWVWGGGHREAPATWKEDQQP